MFSRIIKIIALLVYVYSKKVKNVIKSNLNIMFKSEKTLSEKKAITFKAIEYQIYNLLEFLIMAMGFYNLFKFKVSGLEKFIKLRKSDKNISLISAHFGNWELLGAWFGHKKVPINSIILPPRHNFVSELFEYIRKKYNIGTIIRTNRRDIFKKVLDKDEVVAFIIDQDGESTGYWTDFFGKKVSFPTGAAAFAARKEIVFIPVFILREGFLRHRIIFLDPIDVENIPKQDIKKEFIKKVTCIYEEMFSKYPENWLLIYNRWQYRRHYPICRRNRL